MKKIMFSLILAVAILFLSSCTPRQIKMEIPGVKNPIFMDDFQASSLIKEGDTLLITQRRLGNNIIMNWTMSNLTRGEGTDTLNLKEGRLCVEYRYAVVTGIKK